jgi:hypothetical protein
LQIVSVLTEQLDGSLTVENGVGARFAVSFRI